MNFWVRSCSSGLGTQPVPPKWWLFLLSPEGASVPGRLCSGLARDLPSPKCSWPSPRPGPLSEPLCTRFMDFVCKNRQQCLFHSMVCDGIVQCRDGSDEDVAFAGCCEWGGWGGDRGPGDTGKGWAPLVHGSCSRVQSGPFLRKTCLCCSLVVGVHMRGGCGRTEVLAQIVCSPTALSAHPSLCSTLAWLQGSSPL